MRRHGMLFALVVAGCGGGGEGGTTNPPPAPNSPPEFSTVQSAAQNLGENADIALTVSVSDPDGSPLTLTVTGADAAAFVLDNAARRLTPRKQLDFERPDDQGANNVYDIVVTASDGSLAASKAFTLTVADRPEAFEIDGGVVIEATLARQIFAYAALGDVNQDGRADLAIGAHGVLPGGESYVLSGAQIAGLEARLNHAAAIPSRMTIKSSQPNATAGGWLAAGDIDGDQRADLMIGETFFYSGGFTPSPRTVVVRGSDIATGFGRTLDPALADGQARVVRINGLARNLSVVNDIDGDRFSDFIGANVAEAGGAQGGAGVVYAVGSSRLNAAFGGAPISGTTSNLLSVRGPGLDARLGSTMASLKDFNGDGSSDLLLAAPYASSASSASAFILTGPALSAAQTAGPLNLYLYASTPPPGVIRFNTRSSKSMQVADAGDVNGDGRTDILLGTPNKTTSAFPIDLTMGFLVFGQAAMTPLQDLADPAIMAAAIVFTTNDPDSTLAFAVGAAGDVDRDGRPDIIITNALAGSNDAGAAYLIFGSALQTPGVIAIEDIATTGAGVRIIGAHRRQNLSVLDGPPAGDINGDGYADIVLGAGEADDTTDSRFIVLSGKMLTDEKGLDRTVSLAAMFPETVVP